MQSGDVSDTGHMRFGGRVGQSIGDAENIEIAPGISSTKIFVSIISLTVLLLISSIVQVLRPDFLGTTGFFVICFLVAASIAIAGWLWFYHDLAGTDKRLRNAHQKTRKKLALIQQKQIVLTTRFREEKLRAEAANQSKTAFLAHLSHDVRTPLNHIIGFADLLLHQTFGPIGDARYRAYVEDIKRSGERLLFSFAEILELAEFETGKHVLNQETVDVDEMLLALQTQFQSSANHCGIVFEISGSSRISMMGDRGCLMRMLSNLLENSLRFTPNGGKVSLAVWTAEDGVVLCVTDTGIGIPQDRMRALTAPFALDDAAFARGQGGLGLGLAISRTIAELSGGKLVIDSTPSIGTTVAISLPFHAPHQQHSSKAA